MGQPRINDGRNEEWSAWITREVVSGTNEAGCADVLRWPIAAPSPLNGERTGAIFSEKVRVLNR